MPSRERYQVGIVGLGMIGGSLALAARESGFAESIIAWDRDQEALEQGGQLGVCDDTAENLQDLMQRSDIAVLCVPTLACESLLLDMLQAPGRARCVTDVASVKAPLSAIAATLPPAQAALFVPGHPIAGSERSGVAAARADLFKQHRTILCPNDGTNAEARQLAVALWESAGAEVQAMPVADHDAVLAATSHLPHVLAFALVDALAQSPTRDDIFRFAAGGFRDFTRIASSNPVMWRDIALANRDALLAAVDGYAHHLTQLRNAIERADGEALESIFIAAKEARDQFARELEQRQHAAAK